MLVFVLHGLGQKLLRLRGCPLPVSQPTNNKLKSPHYLRPDRVDSHLQAALFAVLQHNLVVAKLRMQVLMGSEASETPHSHEQSTKTA